MRAAPRCVKKGTEVFAPGVDPGAFLILCSGTLRVAQMTASGREVVLCRVHGGESSILTTACMLPDATSSATGVAETDLELMPMSQDAFDDLLSNSAKFRALVFKVYARRISHLLDSGERAGLLRVDVQLAEWLIDLVGTGTLVFASQREIARELSIAPEVVARHLREFRRRGWVNVGRGIVCVLDKSALRALAQSNPDLVV